METLHPQDQRVIDNLHHAQWVAERFANFEYGRLLNSWLRSNGDGILQGCYLVRLDAARRVEDGQEGWTRLSSALGPGAKDSEVLQAIASLEVDNLAIDKAGYWLVPIQFALDSTKDKLTREQARTSVAKNWGWAIAIIMFIGVLSRCS